jgi:alkanesulfonate monooxygenase SsuD/methylene tetrahydromethanopterin reductase-like flavin-dependent oxidoreductase (luciferase family)
LSEISKGRLIMGMGLGGFPHEFAAAGRPSTLADRAKLAKTNAAICRRLWAGEKVSHRDDAYDFKDVRLKPTPVRPIPIWCGGGTPASCRRAAEYGDGWMPARITLATFRKCVTYLAELCQNAGRPMVTTAVMPFTSIGKSKAAALSALDVHSLIAEAEKYPTWVKPASGRFSTLNDIEGFVLAGTPEDIIRATLAYERAGANHIVYDLRFRYADWHEQIAFLGEEILPALRA